MPQRKMRVLGRRLGRNSRKPMSGAKKSKPETLGREKTLRLREPNAHEARVPANSVGSMEGKGKRITVIPNDFIDFLFPKLDHMSGSKKASNVLIALLRLWQESPKGGKSDEVHASLSLLAKLTAQTVKTVQNNIWALAQRKLITIKFSTGLTHVYKINYDRWVSVTIATMEKQGFELIG